MEKMYQAVGTDGLQIPIAVIRRYGLVQGSGVVLELEPDGIRIVPARPVREVIENRALRYLLSTVGDAATVEVTPLPDGTGWQVNVYGVGLAMPAGVLFYSSSGALLVERSTPPAEMRRAMRDVEDRS